MGIFSMKHTGYAGNFWKFLLVYVTNKRTYTPILSLYLLSMPDTTSKTIGLIFLIGQLTGVFFEVPVAGLLIDLEIKKSLLLGNY